MGAALSREKSLEGKTQEGQVQMATSGTLPQGKNSLKPLKRQEGQALVTVADRVAGQSPEE